MSDECEICWNTGYYHGHGGPCSKGCKPTDHQHGIHKEWTPNESQQDAKILGIVTPNVLSMTDPTFDHFPALQVMVDRACAGEEVTILWPPFEYDVKLQVTSKNRGEITFRYLGSRMAGQSYICSVTAELDVIAHKVPDPTYYGVILRLKGAVTTGEDWIKPGAVAEGRSGPWNGKIARIVNVKSSGSRRSVKIEYLDFDGKGQGLDYFYLDTFSDQFDFKPNWSPRVRTTPFQQPSPPVSPLQVNLTLIDTPPLSIVDVVDRTGKEYVGWRSPFEIIYLVTSGTELDIIVACAGYKTLVLGNLTVPEKDFSLPAALIPLTTTPSQGSP